MGVEFTRKKGRRGIDWHAAKRLFITENIKPGNNKAFTYEDVARAINCTPNRVRIRAAKEKWRGLMLQERARLSDKVVDTVRENAAFSEAAFRLKAAKFGENMMDMGANYLSKVDPAFLTVKEATELLKVGHEIASQAAGINNKAPIPASGTVIDGDYQPVTASIEQADRIKFLASKMLKFVDTLAQK